MRKVPVAALMAACTLVACQSKTVDNALAKDLDAANSSQHLDLAPTGPAQTIESAVERSAQANGGHRLAIETKHQAGGTLHAIPHVILTPTASVMTPTVGRSSGTLSARPQMVPVGYPASGPSIVGSGSSITPAGRGRQQGTSGDGPDYGSGHGGWGVLRGGVIEGDHCDPRPESQRPPKSVDNPLPGIGNGTF